MDINRKIQKAKLELEQMIDLNPSVMLLADNAGIAVRANRALINMLELDDYSTVLGRKIEEIFPSKDKSFFPTLLQNTSGYYSSETTVDLCGKSRLFRFTVIGAGKQTDLFAIIINDITVERQNASSMAKKHKKEAVTELMGALLHNVNQPLTVIMMRAQLMQVELEKGTARQEELRNSLDDIMRLTLDVATILRQVENPQDYVLEHYNKNIDIMDIKQSVQQIDLSDVGISMALMIALNVHEPGAMEHATVTSQSAYILAQHMDLDPLTCETVKRCAFLHDIGKLGIPMHILKKPGPLSPEELTVVRTHSIIGYEILKKFPFLKNEAETAYAHAEWFNGAGYPRKLAGNKIPLPARITAVADAYSAMRLFRSYQPEVPVEEASNIIINGAGTQFDPKVVEAFKKCCNKIETIAPQPTTSNASTLL